MSLDAFVADPWQKSHPAYLSGALGIRPAPEFCTAEIIVASLYRAAGFSSYTENEVPKAGRELEKSTRAGRRHEDVSGRIRLDTWRTVVHGVLESPKRPNQSSKRFLQLCPVVPDVSLYTGSARLAGNSWNPGALVQRMISIGSPTEASARDLWEKLHEALGISTSDDLWARWLQAEFRTRVPTAPAWKPTALPAGGLLPEADKKTITFPAQQFTKDLDSIIAAKSKMTRRQWVSVLEAILRLACVTHVLWLCHVHSRIWARINAILVGAAQAPSLDQVRTELVSAERRYLAYGNAAIADIKHDSSDYLVSRLGINALLWALGDRVPAGCLDSCSGVQELLALVEAQRAALNEKDVRGRFHALTESEARTIACKKGVGSNMVEFATYSLGQRQTADDALRGYDQGYILRKRSKQAPWTVSFGPVAVLALVQCSLRDAAGPRSVRTLCGHLAAYGVDADLGDVSTGELGSQMRMLGLVLDSPDAESGMLLVAPFI